MAFTLAGLAAAASTAVGAYGAYQSGQNASTANKMAGATAAAGLQDSQNQQNYTKALNALALQRSTAGSIDSRGSRASYDPSTNTWRTQLSPEAAAIQAGNDRFNTQNQKDVTVGNAQTLNNNATNATASRVANNGAMANAIQARSGADSARRQLENFRPMSSGELEGNLQQSATTANRQAQDPIIADTLRSFARNGTAAAPVLTSMMRDNATSLRQTVLQDKIAAIKGVGDINNTRRAGLQSTYDTFNNASTPKLQFSQNGALGSASTAAPDAALQNEISSRANGAGTTGIQAGSVSNQGAASSVAARQLAVNSTPYNNSGDILASLAKSFQNKDLQNFGKSVYGSIFGGGAGNAGDATGASPTTTRDLVDRLGY